MIVDRIEYAAEYTQQLPYLADALNTIKNNPNMDAGPHPFPGGYVMRQAGKTKPAETAAFEAHRSYIDVFILAEGTEIVLWNRLENMKEAAPYDAQKDKLALTGTGSALEMKPGMFCVLFPTDAHAPCCHLQNQEASDYVKYVIKLACS